MALRGPGGDRADHRRQRGGGPRPRHRDRHGGCRLVRLRRRCERLAGAARRLGQRQHRALPVGATSARRLHPRGRRAAGHVDRGGGRRGELAPAGRASRAARPRDRRPAARPVVPAHDRVARSRRPHLPRLRLPRVGGRPDARARVDEPAHHRDRARAGSSSTSTSTRMPAARAPTTGTVRRTACSGTTRASTRCSMRCASATPTSCSNRARRAACGSTSASPKHVHGFFLSDPDYTEHHLEVLAGATRLLPPIGILHWSWSQWRGDYPPSKLDWSSAHRRCVRHDPPGCDAPPLRGEPAAHRVATSSSSSACGCTSPCSATCSCRSCATACCCRSPRRPSAAATASAPRRSSSARRTTATCSRPSCSTARAPGGVRSRRGVSTLRSATVSPTSAPDAATTMLGTRARRPGNPPGGRCASHLVAAARRTDERLTERRPTSREGRPCTTTTPSSKPGSTASCATTSRQRCTATLDRSRRAAWSAPREPVPFDEAIAQPFEPVELGWRWGRAWSTVWFRVTGDLP